tara:strand:- start:1195 stop:1386 length:192 start_codon:yes stop_codon:yes gene_type:complete
MSKTSEEFQKRSNNQVTLAICAPVFLSAALVCGLFASAYATDRFTKKATWGNFYNNAIEALNP